MAAHAWRLIHVHLRKDTCASEKQIPAIGMPIQSIVAICECQCESSGKYSYHSRPNFSAFALVLEAVWMSKLTDSAIHLFTRCDPFWTRLERFGISAVNVSSFLPVMRMQKSRIEARSSSLDFQMAYRSIRSVVVIFQSVGPLRRKHE